VHFDDFVAEDARILFVGAHPDDETLAGPLLAYACHDRRRTCEIALFTHGEGGLCQPMPDCENDLGVTRAAEASKAASGYGAALVLGTFPNATSVQLMRDDALDWAKQQWVASADPQAWIGAVIADFLPDLILTLDPDHGFTGHVEHELASRYVATAIAPPTSILEVLNHYEPLSSVTGQDPGIATETWDVLRSCGGGETCLDATVRIAAAHVSQQSSILSLLQVGIAGGFLDRSYLDQVTARRTHPLH
jgi:LmbE family N-acetylglucosaminyl deacetylase